MTNLIKGKNNIFYKKFKIKNPSDKKKSKFFIQT